LTQAVGTPADSLNLRSMQDRVTPLVAQMSGQSIEGAVGGAIGEALGDNGALVTPTASGIRFNFAGEADGQRPSAAIGPRAPDPFSSAFADNGESGPRASADSRVGRSFDAIGMPAKAPPLPQARESRDWYGWAEVQGATLSRWGAQNALASSSALYGNQINLLAGLTRKLTPDVVVGVLGGYETFDYRSDAVQGRLKGDGWTLGSYLGWRFAPHLRFDGAIAYSGIGYDGSAGTAAGSFGGTRWLASGGVTGSYRTFALQLEPSARVYALWEHEGAYTDTLGTLQADRSFATGRASSGVKLSYPTIWDSGMKIAPYAGLFGDYYFNRDTSSAAASIAAPPIPLVLDGWSARATGGIAASLASGAQLEIGGERGGLGGNVAVWTYRARASVPFGAR
jgi:Autotransporter beta-domain